MAGEARTEAREALTEARKADRLEAFGNIGTATPEEPASQALANIAAATREIVSALSGGAVHVVFPQTGLFLIALGLLCVFLAARRVVAVVGAKATRAEAWTHDLWGAERVLLAGLLVVLLPVGVVLYVANLGDSVDVSGLLELVAGLLVIAPIAVLVGERRWALLRLWGAKIDDKASETGTDDEAAETGTGEEGHGRKGVEGLGWKGAAVAGGTGAGVALLVDGLRRRMP
ncbi:hypothetical protein [Nesterenkonia sp. CF4.4]|uniref:hypothetical protein n=1 Tax=Nesterenkonia sp. CF4.4 TaxID=3373079 RepID=UPI003EE6CD3D